MCIHIITDNETARVFFFFLGGGCSQETNVTVLVYGSVNRKTIGTRAPVIGVQIKTFKSDITGTYYEYNNAHVAITSRMADLTGLFSGVLFSEKHQKTKPFI